MQFGTFHLMERPFHRSEAEIYREQLDQMVLADEVGFDSVWLTEHHFSSAPYVPDVSGEYCISNSPFALACAVAQITRRVRIGSAVKVLPLEHPLRTAEDAALADILSGGRIDFGAGLGYRQYEFDGLQVPIEERAERFREALKIITGVWTTEEFAYEGRFWSIPRLTLVPRPLQRPHPPVWIATRRGNADTINYALDNDYRLLIAWASHSELRATYELTKETRIKRGLGSEPFDFTCLRHVFVAESDREARELGAGYVEYYMKSTAQFRPIGAHERDEMIFGGPDTVIAALRALQETAGVTSLICWMNFGGMPQEVVGRSMRLFASEVMPAMRRTPTASPAFVRTA
jgi:alkanesulfonate monooxygenase SsuD/methylene tetrahydromethanopterin reductase-like flavin-dependent oxidoreductase (luciferase family)